MQTYKQLIHHSVCQCNICVTPGFYQDTLCLGDGGIADIGGSWRSGGCAEPLVRESGGKPPRSWKLFVA